MAEKGNITERKLHESNEERSQHGEETSCNHVSSTLVDGKRSASSAGGACRESRRSLSNDAVGDDIDGDIRVGFRLSHGCGDGDFSGDGFGGGWSDGSCFGGSSSGFARKWTVGGVGGDEFSFGNSNHSKAGGLGDRFTFLSGARGDCYHSSANFSLGGRSFDGSLGGGGGSLDGSLGGGFGEWTHSSNHCLLTVNCGGVDRRSSWLGGGVT